MRAALLVLLPAIALADAPIVEVPEHCAISKELRVTGPDRAPCVEKLETAARLARAEQRVNASVKRRAKR